MPGDLNAAYVRARSVLLDALEALAEHRSAIILVRAQAVYVHTSDSELATAPFTTDADLALDPAVLGPTPLLEALLFRAGFSRSTVADAIGTWIGAAGIPVDLMVPAEVAGSGSRAARLGPHGNRIARRARGLEAALVDHQEHMLQSLEADDSRQIPARVAGPAALLVAKLHKLADRQNNPRRQDDKDALDIYRLLQETPTMLLTQKFQLLLRTPVSAEITQEALTYLTELFGSIDSSGSRMAGRAVESLDDPDTVAASCAALAQDLLESLPTRTP